MATRLKKRSSSRNDWRDRADDALDAALKLVAGPARMDALKDAAKLRNAADMYALFFNDESSPTKRPEVGKHIGN